MMKQKVLAVAGADWQSTRTMEEQMEEHLHQVDLDTCCPCSCIEMIYIYKKRNI
jgi:hypothetical protein